MVVGDHAAGRRPRLWRLQFEPFWARVSGIGAEGVLALVSQDGAGQVAVGRGGARGQQEQERGSQHHRRCDHCVLIIFCMGNHERNMMRGVYINIHDSTAHG
jgi:hypothetical protein